jgi:16S rRNA (cytosine967-C5)-methyltransferase
MANPRKTALTVLNELEKGTRTLDSVLAEFSIEATFAARQDRALFNALVYGVLRWRARLDRVISHFSSMRPAKIDPKVMNILRLGLFQIIYLDRIPASAAVDTSVELAKTVAAPWIAGFVNALLRNAADRRLSVPFPDLEKEPVRALASTKSFPSWLIKRWLDRFGTETVAALCDALNSIPPISMRTNTLKTSRINLIHALEDSLEKVEPGVYTMQAVRGFNPRESIPKLEAFKRGWFQVQDEAAQLVSLLLNPQPGEKILDACAGLGGKTGHIAQLMKDKGHIVAMDKDAARLSRLESEMNRLGVTIVSIRQKDLNNSFRPSEHEGFDRVLLDAPCSGLGVLRRNPDIKWVASKKNLKPYAERQMRFLENLARLVKPSGVLVYAVCSIEPEENEAVVKAFLKKHPDYVTEKDYGKLPARLLALIKSDGSFKTHPHLLEMDGFFMTRLKRLK